MPEKVGKLVWDQPTTRKFEAGVDHGVYYPRDDSGAYTNGVAWSGLTAVNETPSGAEPNKQYADNIPYLVLMSAEDFGATISAFHYPPEFGEADGTVEIAPGVILHQQNRRTFGLSYRTKIGNDITQNLGYKIHLIYGAQVSPSERAYNTINESPEALNFSWTITTTPVDFPGFMPAANIEFDSTTIDPVKLNALETILYGSETTAARLPTPEELVTMFKEEIETSMMNMRKARMASSVMKKPD